MYSRKLKIQQSKVKKLPSNIYLDDTFICRYKNFLEFGQKPDTRSSNFFFKPSLNFEKIQSIIFLSFPLLEATNQIKNISDFLLQKCLIFTPGDIFTSSKVTLLMRNGEYYFLFYLREHFRTEKGERCPGEPRSLVESDHVT